MNIIFHVAKDGSGDFCSVTEALNALAKADRAIFKGNPDMCGSAAFWPATFFLHNGIYEEHLVIRRPHLTLWGESAERTVLTYGLYARIPWEDTGKFGTFRSYSCLVDTHDFQARDLTFQNNAGKGPDVGQALALYADGDRLVFERCRFLGGQDTLFTGPLPLKEKEPNGFVGPKQFAPRVAGRQYYHNCYLEGDVDFVFGGAAAYFENCEFHSRDIGQKVNSYVAAASTPRGQAFGYVMQGCRFTGSCPPHTAYLGRPWRKHAQTVLLDCYIGSHIREEGWHDWNKPHAHDTVFYGEFKSHGPSGDLTKRPGWVRRLTPAEAAQYTKEAILKGDDGWNPNPAVI